VSQIQKWFLAKLLPFIGKSNKYIIYGDFNKQIQGDKKTNSLCNFIEQTIAKKTNKECVQLINGPTTDYNTTLDLAFTNIKEAEVSFIECSWSDHKAISLFLQI